MVHGLLHERFPRSAVRLGLLDGGQHLAAHQHEDEVVAVADGPDEVARRERKSTSIWGKALKRATGAAMGSGASIAAASITGRKSRANPGKTAVSSGLGSIATDLAGPLAGRFVRNLIGGLMR